MEENLMNGLGDYLGNESNEDEKKKNVKVIKSKDGIIEVMERKIITEDGRQLITD